MIQGDSLFTWDIFHDTDAIRSKAMISAGTGGPNSGFEIEGMDLFKDPQLTGDFPDLKDDVDLVISTEAYVRRLVDFRKRLLATQGMSRGMSYELLELIPDMQSHIQPSHFTDSVTGVKYSVSLEAISAKIWAMIAAGIAVIIGIIIKFRHWLFGTSGGSSEEEMMENVRNTDTYVKKQSQAFSDVAKAVSRAKHKKETVEITKTVPTEEITHSQIHQDLQKDLIKANETLIKEKEHAPTSEEDKRSVQMGIDLSDLLFSMTNDEMMIKAITEPSVYEIITFDWYPTDLRSLIFNTAAKFPEYAANVALRIQMFEEILDIVDEVTGEPKNSGDVLKMSHMLDLQTKHKIMDGEIQFKGQRFASIGALAKELASFIQFQKNEGTKKNFNDLSDLISLYNDGLATWKTVDFSRCYVLYDVMKKALPILKRAEALTKRHHANYNAGVELNTGTGYLYDECLEGIMYHSRDLSRDFYALCHIFEILRKCAWSIQVYGKKLMAVLNKNIHGISVFYHKYDLPMPEIITMTEEEIAKALDTYNRNTIRKPAGTGGQTG